MLMGATCPAQVNLGYWQPDTLAVQCSTCAAFVVVSGAELLQAPLMGRYRLLDGVTRSDRPVWRSTVPNTVE